MTEKRLKILQVVPYFYPAWPYGGVPRVVYELSRELVKRGHDVTVYTTDVFDEHTRYKKREAIVDGIKVHYFRNLSNHLAYNYQLYLPVGLIGFARKTVRDFDIIHLHSHRHFLNSIVHCYALKNKIPYIISAHGTVLRIERRLREKAVFDMLFGNRVLRDAAYFTAVSEFEVEQYTKMGVDKSRIAVIYNGLDMDTFRILPERNYFKNMWGLTRKKVILFMGRISSEKGIDFLVKAFARLPEKDDTVVVIAGNDMGFKDQVLNVAREENISDKIIFTGFLKGKEKLSAYQDADMLVHPAVNDIFGLAPFEAIMCNTPVIVTEGCGCGRIIQKEDIGYTVEYNNVQSLKDKIREVLADKAGAMEKVQRGKKFIEDSLSWEKLASNYEDVYMRWSGH